MDAPCEDKGKAGCPGGRGRATDDASRGGARLPGRRQPRRCWQWGRQGGFKVLDRAPAAYDPIEEIDRPWYHSPTRPCKEVAPLAEGGHAIFLRAMERLSALLADPVVVSRPGTRGQAAIRPSWTRRTRMGSLLRKTSTRRFSAPFADKRYSSNRPLMMSGLTSPQWTSTLGAPMRAINRRALVRLFAGAALAGLFPMPAVASTIIDEDSSLVPFTEDLALEVAENFALSMSDNSSVIARNATRCYGSDHVVNGYLVDLYLDGNPYGYVCLDVSKPGLLSSCSFGPNARSPLHLLLPETQVYGIDETQHILMLSPLEFGISESQSGTMTFTNGSSVWSVPEVSFLSNKPDNWSDVMITTSELGKYTLSNVRYIEPFDAIPQNYIEQYVGYYACAVTALCIVSSKMDIGSIYTDPSIYMQLWHATSTQELPEEEQTNPNAILGSTQNGNIAPGFQAYALQRGRSIIGSGLNNPSYSTFKNYVDLGRNSIISVNLYSGGGHSLCVQGYAIATLGGSSINTLAVADGWTGSIVYLTYNPTDYQSKYASVFYG